MKLRPHHILDIISAHGHGSEFKPHPTYGHAVHTVARALIGNLETELDFVIGADEICKPCIHLQEDGQCDDVLQQLSPPISKQDYNDQLDTRLFQYLNLSTDRRMTFRQYLALVEAHLPELADICSHPGEDPAHRLTGLTQGICKLLGR